MSLYKTPFKDALETEVPKRGSHGGEYDSQEVPGTPGRDGGVFPELHRDGFVKGEPECHPSKGYKTPFKDAV